VATGGEREQLRSWLEFHRATFACDLDALSAAPGPWADEPVSMRWLLFHVVEEYARHNGHADLLRERIDGSSGW